MEVIWAKEASERAAIDADASEWMRLVVEHAATIAPAHQQQEQQQHRVRRDVAARSSGATRSLKSINDVCRHFSSPPASSPIDGPPGLGVIIGQAVSRSSAPLPGAAPILPHPPQQTPTTFTQKTQQSHDSNRHQLFHQFQLQQLMLSMSDEETKARGEIDDQEIFEREYLADDVTALLGVLREKHATRQLALLAQLHHEMPSSNEGNQRSTVASRPFTASTVPLHADDWSRGGIGSPTTANNEGLRFPPQPVPAPPPAAAKPRCRTARPQPQPWGTMVAVSTSAAKRKGSALAGTTRMLASVGDGSGGPSPPDVSRTSQCYSARSAAVLRRELHEQHFAVRPVRFAVPSFSLPAPTPVFPGSKPTEKSRYLFTRERSAV